MVSNLSVTCAALLTHWWINMELPSRWRFHWHGPQCQVLLPQPRPSVHRYTTRVHTDLDRKHMVLSERCAGHCVAFFIHHLPFKFDRFSSDTVFYRISLCQMMLLNPFLICGLPAHVNVCTFIECLELVFPLAKLCLPFKETYLTVSCLLRIDTIVSHFWFCI